MRIGELLAPQRRSARAPGRNARASGELELAADGLDRMGLFLDPSQLPRRTRIMMRLVMALQFDKLPPTLRAQYAERLDLARPHPRTAGAVTAALRAAIRFLPHGLISAPRRAGSAAASSRERIARRMPHPFGDRQPSMCIPASPDADPRHSKAFTQPPVP